MLKFERHLSSEVLRILEGGAEIQVLRKLAAMSLKDHYGGGENLCKATARRPQDSSAQSKFALTKAFLHAKNEP